MFRILQYLIIFQILIISLPIRYNPTLPIAESQENIQSSLHGRKPTWSPDGRLIAFVSDSSGNNDIWTIEPDGTNPRNLTVANPDIDDYPAWSPDGTRIAFVSTQAGKADIWVMQFDGTNSVNLTADYIGNHYTPTWSPNGRLIAFITENVPLISYDVWVMESNGANPVKLTSGENHVYDDITWSPDSRNLAFRNAVVDPKIHDFSELTSPEQIQFDGVLVATIEERVLSSLTSKRYDIDVAWSPHGNLLALATQESSLACEIWLIAPDGSSLTNLTAFRSGRNLAPVWSPDGNRLAFISQRDEEPHNWDIWVINADGSNPINLTRGIGFTNVDPSWSPDGKRITFASFSITDTGADIWIINADGSEPINLTIGKQ